MSTAAPVTHPNFAVAPDNDSSGAPRAGRPRKPKRIGPDGKPMHRMIIVVSETDHKKILEAIANQAGGRFVKEFVFGAGDKEEFTGSMIAQICADMLVSNDDDDDDDDE